jgi:hypothetical protein
MREGDGSRPQIEPFNVIFCDDIRREISGKEILIGVYSSDILIPSVPTVLGISLWIQIRARGKGAARSRLRVTDPSGNTAGETVLEYTIDDSKAAQSQGETISSITLPQLPLNIAQAGTIDVLWASDGEFVPIGRKQVTIGPVPTAFGQLSAQSPPVNPAA